MMGTPNPPHVVFVRLILKTVKGVHWGPEAIDVLETRHSRLHTKLVNTRSRLLGNVTRAQGHPMAKFHSRPAG